MRMLVLSTILLFVHFARAQFEQIICHNDLIQRDRPLTQLAFNPSLTAEYRSDIALQLIADHASPQLFRLFNTPRPRDYPITAAECLDAASLIPQLPLLDSHRPGDPDHPNLRYTDAGRQKILQYRLDAGFVSGNCMIQILRRPVMQNPGLPYADASAMALSVYPHAREKALEVIQHCLSGDHGLERFRFGHVGTKSVLRGANFYYVVSVTLFPGEQFRFVSEHFYNRSEEIERRVEPDVGPMGWSYSFKFNRAFFRV
ncbi:hypothetical protein MMC13_000386 [Lambiella insularis]|nr:hypothetical protein [Lambiella insularis]